MALVRPLALCFSFISSMFLLFQAPDALGRRVEECGIERVDYLRGPSCPAEAYFEVASRACGVSAYNARTDRSCPGYVARDVITRSQISRVPSCPSGYRAIDQDQSRGCDDCNKPKPISYRVTCERPEFIPTCRLPAFGVKSYKSCRHPSHGVELHTACLQIPVFAECDLLKTRVELDSFLVQVGRTIPVTGPLLVSNEGLIAKLSGNADALACVIKSWEDDPLHTPVIDQLKGDFAKLTGRPYGPEACSGGTPHAVSCAPGDASDLCRAKNAVAEARTLFSLLLSEISALRDDVVPRSEPAYRDRLDALTAELSRYLP